MADAVLTTTGGRKPCAEGMARNEKTNRCIKVKTHRPCPKGQVRNEVTKRCRNMSTSLTASQRADFDQMLHIMRQPVGRKGTGHDRTEYEGTGHDNAGNKGAKSKNKGCEDINVAASLSVASDDQLKTEMERRGFTVTNPVVHVLVPRKKGEPRPT